MVEEFAMESLRFWQEDVKPITLASGEILFQQGEPAKNIFWLESGRVKLVNFAEPQMVFHYWVNGEELFGETVLFEPTYGCTAIATQSSTVIPMDKHEFLAALSKSQDLNDQYLAHLTKRFSDVKKLLTLRSIRSARDRLLHALSGQLVAGENTVSLLTSLKELAFELGISPEALSRAFAQIESEGIIQRKKGRIIFADAWLRR